MSEKVFGITLLALGILFLWIYDTGRWGAVLQVLSDPSATQQALAAQKSKNVTVNAPPTSTPSSGGHTDKTGQYVQDAVQIGALFA